MKIKKNTVVTLIYKLFDAQNNDLLEEDNQNIVYLHGGYAGIFEKLEEQLEGKDIGFNLKIQLEPDDAFGQYDAELLRLEDSSNFPDNIAIGMQFEGLPDSFDEPDNDINTHEFESDENEFEEELPIFVVTDIVGDKILLDGNHPLAGMAIKFDITVKDIRQASVEEIEQGYISDEESNFFSVVKSDKSPPTLH